MKGDGMKVLKLNGMVAEAVKCYMCREEIGHEDYAYIKEKNDFCHLSCYILAGRDEDD